MRLVQLAVAMVATSSTTCSVPKWPPRASRSTSSTLPGWLVSRSVNRRIACSSTEKTSLRRLPPGSFSALICSSVSPRRFPEAVWLRVQ